MCEMNDNSANRSHFRRAHLPVWDESTWIENLSLWSVMVDYNTKETSKDRELGIINNEISSVKEEKINVNKVMDENIKALEDQKDKLKKRTTGRTTRLILDSLSDASDGELILFVTSGDHWKKACFGMAGNAIDCLCNANVNPFGQTIEFESGGNLRFVTVRELEFLSRSIDVSKVWTIVRDEDK